MIADALRLEIERYSLRMRTDNPLFTRAEQGTLTSVHIAQYLASIRYLVAHTLPHLARAAELARAAGEARLGDHFEHKAKEEVGHDLWAERDMERVRARIREAGRREAVPAMRDMVAAIGATIEQDPALHLAYMLFAEYLVTLLGPEWLLLLEQRCDVPRSSMTFIDNHSELDKEHAEEAFDLIDDLVGDPRKLPLMREVVLGSIERFQRFSVEVVAVVDAEHAQRAHQAPAA